MNEDIIVGVGSVDKSVAILHIEPLHRSLYATR